MVGSAATFLSYNETNVMKQLLAVEAHLRELGTNYKGEHASCIIKHLLMLDEQCEEGISHASELSLHNKAEIFKEIHDEIPALRKALEQGANPNDLIRKVRELRRKAESLNPTFNLEQCKACGVDEVLAKLKIPKTSLAELEEETAHRIIEHLSAKYNVPKPKLQLLNECPTEPTQFGMFQAKGGQPEIVLCRGSADVHKTTHEFGHYLQFLSGKPLNEQEAEQFAIKEMQKTLYVEASHNRHSGEFSMALTWRETGFIVGGQHVGVALQKVFEYVDSMAGKAVAPIAERPSTWINIAGGLALILYPRLSKRVSPTMDLLMTVIGGHMTTKLWDYVGAATPAAGLSFAPATAIAPTPTQISPTPTLGVKYRVTA